MLLLKYEIEEILECEPRVKECCERDKNPPEPPDSGDCCYDTWVREFKQIDAEYNQADKRVTHLTTRRDHLQTQRDMWKAWKDELDKACDVSKEICQQLEILIHHTSRISRNTGLAKRSITLLFCMLRDFYMQIDLLKKKYDYLVNCIKCRNNPGLTTGQGIMALIEDYGARLDVVIQTRDVLFEKIISAISIINNINKNIGHQGHRFGFGFILREWKRAFNCEGNSENTDNDSRRYEHVRNDYRPQPSPSEGEFEDTGLEPMFVFPICDSHYYRKVENRYKEDNEDFMHLSNELLRETKHRDNLKALKDGLTAVMSDPNVDPSKRCATATK
jgi:hypothetical protein